MGFLGVNNVLFFDSGYIGVFRLEKFIEFGICAFSCIQTHTYIIFH